MSEIIYFGIEFLFHSALLMAMLWVMIKCQKMNYTFLGLLGTAAAGGALELRGDEFTGGGFVLVAPGQRGPIDGAAASRHEWASAGWNGGRDSMMPMDGFFCFPPNSLYAFKTPCNRCLLPDIFVSLYFLRNSFTGGAS